MRCKDYCLCILLLLCSTACRSQHHGRGSVDDISRAGHAADANGGGAPLTSKPLHSYGLGYSAKIHVQSGGKLVHPLQERQQQEQQELRSVAQRHGNALTQDAASGRGAQSIADGTEAAKEDIVIQHVNSGATGIPLDRRLAEGGAVGGHASTSGAATSPAALPTTTNSKAAAAPTTDKQLPNFVVLLVDDQDELLNSTHPHYMPALDKHLAQGGTRLSDFTVPTPVCCPARAALLTGQYPHCSNVTANFYPGGAYQKFVELGLDSSYLPGWLQDAGYDTYMYGKFLNQYVERSRYQPPGYYPRGWTVFQALTHENTYAYYNSCFALNGSPRECFPGQYQTDLITEMATGTIRATAALGRPRPFLLYLAPAAPHLESSPQRPMAWTTPRPAGRHASLYADENITLPRSPNYNAPDPLVRRPPLDASAQARFQQQYLARLRCMRAIDEMLDAVVTELDTHGMLDNTYIIHTSDNGYHFGSFRLGGGKARPIEEDIHVPFYIRGPGVPAGEVLPYQGSMIDVAPTLLALAGVPIPPSVNGLPLPVAGRLVGPHARALQASLPPGSPAPPVSAVWWQRDAVLVEGWWSSGEVDAEDGDSRTSVYKVLRLCTDLRVLPDSGARGDGGGGGPPPRIAGTLEGWSCYKYVAWCGGNQRAFYDLSTDPYELRNRLPDVPSRMVDRFDAILSSLIHCRGAACRNPYAALHPEQRVYNLTGAANPLYDDLYRTLYKFKYDRCLPVYDPRYERTWTQHLGPLL